jgi:transcriptional regulator with XRE-family HTH domain
VDKAQRELVKKRFGAQMRRLRKARKMSQEDVAYAAGLDRSYLGAIERGEKNLSLVNIHRIANALQVETGELFRQ